MLNQFDGEWYQVWNIKCKYQNQSILKTALTPVKEDCAEDNLRQNADLK